MCAEKFSEPGKCGKMDFFASVEAYIKGELGNDN